MECPVCGYEMRVTCIDDICHAIGECIHGDDPGWCDHCANEAVDDDDTLEPEES